MTYAAQFLFCQSDGTSKTMTLELAARVPTEHVRMIYGADMSERQDKFYFCGKKDGLCSSWHCRTIHPLHPRGSG